MKQHIAACLKVPSVVKVKYDLATESKSGAFGAFGSRCTSSATSASSTSGSRSVMQTTNITTTPEPCQLTTPDENKNSKGSTPRRLTRLSLMHAFMDKITPVDQETANEKLARAIFVSGASLRLVENPYWVEFLNFIRPAYNIPSRHEISVPLLNKEYDRVSAHVKETLASSASVGLMCDGWSNIRNEAIVNFVVTTPVPILYKILPTGKESHTGKYMAEKINEVIQDIGAQKVFGLVTDNAANMKAAWNILELQYSGTNLFTYGCLAHSLNLIFTDIKSFNSIKSFVAEVVSVVKHIRQSHILSAAFKEKQPGQQQIVTLKLPVQTRWSSLVHCLESVQSNKQALKSLSIDEEVQSVLKKNPIITKNILSDVFWDKVDSLLHLLKPIANAILYVESDTPTISKVMKIFQDLQKHFNEYLPTSLLSKQEEKEALAVLENRRSFAISEVHMAANLLDPASFGEDLTPEEQTDAMEIIYKAAVKMPEVDANIILADLANYRAKTAIFGKEFLWQAQAVKSISPVAWWKGFCQSMQLAKLAVRFLELPATSAACERTFSTYTCMHTSKRNRLTNARAGKIVYIAQNLKILKETGDFAVKANATTMGGPTSSEEQNSTPGCSGVRLSETETIFIDSAEDSDDGSIASSISIALDSTENSSDEEDI